MLQPLIKKHFQPTSHFYSALLIVIIAGILFGFLLRLSVTAVSKEPRIIKMCYGHFTDPADDNSITLIEPVRGNIDSNYIAVYRKKGSEPEKLWESPPAPIWDIFLADVDGDGLDELALCLFKTEQKDPKKDNRLQIYGWREGNIYARWRGTFLSKPFKIIAFGDIYGDAPEELVSIERGRIHPEQIYLCVYLWNSFGFDFLAQKRLQNIPEKVLVTDSDSNGNGIIKLGSRKSALKYTIKNHTLVQMEETK